MEMGGSGWIYKVELDKGMRLNDLIEKVIIEFVKWNP